MSVLFTRAVFDRRQALVGMAAVAGGLAAPAAVQAQGGANAQQAMTDYGDVHSYAQPDRARVTHVALDLTVDFEAKRLAGTATLDLLVAPGVRDVILDTGGGLEVLGVTDEAGDRLPFRMGDADPILGRPLTVQLAEYPRTQGPSAPSGPTRRRRIVVRYRTAPAAGALQWLEPAQTAGGRRPYLFSQGQAILTRTWIPTQDSPGIRQTWEARIAAPRDLRAVISAPQVSAGRAALSPPGVFSYRMPHPVPPYLIAIAVGDIQFRSLGRRTGVYSEPSMLDASASEFVDTERMVEVAERLYGPYRWGRYDLLVLPPSFPFGGMENPTLTFATPTLLTGDRSLVSLVAHELAHSWSGNLVTNATWADFWLNEGFTTYFENRIMEALYGDERAAMLRALGWQDLQRAIAEEGGPTGPDTRLRLDLRGRDPDDGTTDIAYEKGALFLRTIEQAAGRARFDGWLRSWFDRRAFQPATTDLFLTDLRANLIRGDRALERRIQAEEWIDRPGLPSGAVEPRSRLIDTVDAQARAFAGGRAASGVQTRGWVSQQWQRFLRQLPRTLPAARLRELDSTFGLSRQTNGEILFDWLELAIANRFDSAVPSLESFLTRQGRRKFVLPLYRDLLAQGDWGYAIARRVYAATRARYHPLTQRSIDQAFTDAAVSRG